MQTIQRVRPSGPNASIAALTACQGGHITRRQLFELGLTKSAVHHLLSRGHLIPVLRGVYAVGHVPTASSSRAHAPLLAVGDRSALAGWSATNGYTNAVRWVEPFTVITPLQSRPAGLKTLHTQQLRASDIQHIHGLRAVSPALAMLHVAPDLRPKVLIRLIDNLRINHDLTHDALERVCRRFPRQAPSLRGVLDELQPEPTRSSWEQEWPGFAERHELPPYEMNVHVLTYRVDVLFDGLVVMLDGWHVHGSRHAFEHDREEVAEIMASTGLPVLRVTHRQFHRNPSRQATRIRQILARSGGRLAGVGIELGDQI